MDTFKKDNDIMSGKGETDDVQWITVNGAHIPIKDGETPKQALQKHSTKSGGRGIMQLPPQEYAQLCSTIRTKYANKIPRTDGIFVGDYYYRFAYRHDEEKITCKRKIKIVGNEDYIAVLEARKW